MPEIKTTHKTNFYASARFFAPKPPGVRYAARVTEVENGRGSMTSSRHRNVYEDGAVCFWTSSVTGFVPAFTSRTACLRLLSIWDRNRGRYGVRIVGCVVMPNHIHIAVWSKLASQVQKFLGKSLEESSREVIELTRRSKDRGDARCGGWLGVFENHAGSGTKAAFWKERGRAFPVTTGDGLRQKLRYMHENPVRAGLCETSEPWEFSSASWYTSGTGPLVIDPMEGW